MKRRVAVIGDVGGHLEVFEGALAAAGVEGFTIPDHLQVVQVGDLVHKGPDDAGCVELADVLLRENPGRYVQLVGNHDGHYIGGADVSRRPGVQLLGPTHADTVARWWATGAMRVAVAADVRGWGRVLISHAGLTAAVWDEIGAPEDAAEAARALNDAPAELLHRGGCVLGNPVDAAAGPLWAEAGCELGAGWAAVGAMPFTQIHGHGSCWWWPDDARHWSAPEALRIGLDRGRRQCWVEVGERRLWSVDWTLLAEAPAEPLEPLILPGRLV